MFPGASHDLQALLDLGSHKIACAIVAPASGRILSHVVTPSAGIRAGDVRDPRAAHGAVVSAIVEAERRAGAQAIDALVAVGCGVPQADCLTADVVLDPPIVTAEITTRLRAGLLSHAERDGRVAIQISRGNHRLDGRAYDTLPIGRFGRVLELDLTAVTVDRAPLHRLLGVIEATDLPAAGVVPAGVAAALAVTTIQEREQGTAVVSIGAEQTTVATYALGQLTGISALALGISHMVADVAAALQVTPSKAERIISECGINRLAHAGHSDALAPLGNSGFLRTPLPGTSVLPAIGPDARAALTDSLGTRLETLLRLVADRIDAPAAGLSQRNAIVLTGGGSLVAGLAEHAAHIWGRRVVCGAPVGFDGRDMSLTRPDAAVMAGLVIATRQPTLGVRFDRTRVARQTA
jgi:cell division protein FtsA